MITANNEIDNRVLKLDNTSYADWKVFIKWQLVKDYSWEVVQMPRPENASSDWKRANDKAMARLFGAIERSQLTYMYVNVNWLMISGELWKKCMRRHPYQALYSYGGSSGLFVLCPEVCRNISTT